MAVTGHKKDAPLAASKQNSDAPIKSTHEGAEDLNHDTTKKGYTTSLDIDGTPLYHYKFRRQHDHVFLEQLISRDDFGDEYPRYYVGTNEDAQPMTLPELTTLIQDLIRFYGDAVSDRNQTGEER